MALREDVLQAAVDGRLSTQDVAQALGVEPAVVDRLTAELRAARRRRRSVLVLGGVGAVVLAGLVARPALAQAGCPQTLPAPLVTFCSDTPAQASQVNANFQGVLDFMAAKLGPLSATGITVGGVTTTGAVSASTLTSTT